MWRRWLRLGLLPALLLASGCQATGMGWIPSALVPTDKATFGFVFDGTTSTLSGSYHDPQGTTTMFGVVDVAFKGTGVMRPCKAGDPACVNAPPAKGGCLLGELQYDSQNPKIPGSGFFFLLVCDADGNGPSVNGDFVLLTVDTGPYTGYRNTGNPQGNITVKM